MNEIIRYLMYTSSSFSKVFTPRSLMQHVAAFSISDCLKEAFVIVVYESLKCHQCENINLNNIGD